MMIQKKKENDFRNDFRFQVRCAESFKIIKKRKRKKNQKKRNALTQNNPPTL